MLPDPIDNASRLPWEEDYKLDSSIGNLPGLSIVLPIFNAGRFLERTLRSLLCNDLTDVEIIVMDGGSTDNTFTILDQYRQYLSVCVSAPDDGQSDAINRGFNKASQPILYWLNGDDLLLPNVLTQVRSRFAQPDRPDVVVGNAYMTELDLKPINYFHFSSDKLKFEYLLDYAEHHLVQPSVFFSRRAWDTCGPLANYLHFAMDADLFLKMSAQFEMVHFPLDIAYSVYHEDCKTRGKRAESIAELAIVQAKHGGMVESQKTLDILVAMHNRMELKVNERRDESSSVPKACPHCKVNKLKIVALEQQWKQKMKLLLDADLVKV